MNNDSSEEEHTAHVIPFSNHRHEVSTKDEKKRGQDLLEDQLINEILADYYDHFEENSEFIEGDIWFKESFDSEEFHMLYDKIEVLQEEIVKLEDEIRFYLQEIKTFLPTKK